MNLAFDHRQATPGERTTWHGVERRQARQPQGRIMNERALLALTILILALAAVRGGVAPQTQGSQATSSLPAAAPAAHVPRIGVIGASATDLRAVAGLLDPTGSGRVTVIDTAASGGPAAAVNASALRAMLADAGVCVALALAPAGDLAEARRLADAAADADKPGVFVFSGIDPRIRLLNRGNSRLGAVSTPAEGAARALDLARLRGCAPRIEAAPLPARG